MLLDTLYYDGKCPLCRREIVYLERYSSSTLKLVDIHNLNEGDFADFASVAQTITASQTSAIDNLSPPTTQVAMLEFLHLRRQTGVWLIGLDATVAAWQHSAFGFLFKPLRWPAIKPLADRLYASWAKKRFCQLNY